MGQAQAVVATQGVRVRQDRGVEQAHQAVRASVHAQPANVAQERGHNAAESGHGHEHARRPINHGRHPEPRSPVVTE